MNIVIIITIADRAAQNQLLYVNHLLMIFYENSLCRCHYDDDFVLHISPFVSNTLDTRCHFCCVSCNEKQMDKKLKILNVITSLVAHAY